MPADACPETRSPPFEALAADAATPGALTFAAAHSCDAPDSPAAGHAGIPVVPDPMTGSVLARQMISLASAASPGAMLGARVPIALARLPANKIPAP